MVSQELQEEEPSYFFDDSLKKIFKNNDKPSFSVAKSDSYHEKKHKNYLSERRQAVDCEKKMIIKDHSLQEENNFDSAYSWKEFFFFSNNDGRLTDGILFFNSRDENDFIQFDEVRKKLKYCVRHKMSKRRNMKMKKKFNKRNFKTFFYKNR